jgi:hypothetical protein
MKTFEEYIKEAVDFRLGGSSNKGLNQDKCQFGLRYIRHFQDKKGADGFIALLNEIEDWTDITSKELAAMKKCNSNINMLDYMELSDHDFCRIFNYTSEKEKMEKLLTSEKCKLYDSKPVIMRGDIVFPSSNSDVKGKDCTFYVRVLVDSDNEIVALIGKYDYDDM